MKLGISGNATATDIFEEFMKREQIEQAARELVLTYEEDFDISSDQQRFKGLTQRVINFTLAQVEKVTADLRKDLEIVEWNRDHGYIKQLHRLEVEQADRLARDEIAQKIVDRTHCDHTSLQGNYDFDAGLDQLEYNVAAQAREECAKILEEASPLDARWLIAQAIRATIKENNG